MFKFSMASRFLKDCFSTKYPTIQLFDGTGGWYCFPLRSNHIYDGKFFVRVGQRMYVLAIDQSKIQTYRGKMAPPIQTILYNVRDTKPIDLADIKTVRDFCERNNIRKIHDVEALLICAYARYQNDGSFVRPDEVLSFGQVINMLLDIEGHPEGSRERSERKGEYEDAVRRMGTSTLEGPLQPVSTYLGNKLVDDPESINNLVVGASRMNFEWKAIANPAKGPFKYWLLVLGIIFGTIAAAGAAYYFLGDGGGASPEDIFERLKTLDESGAEAPDDLTGGGDTLVDQLFAEGNSDAFDSIADTVGGFVDPGPEIPPEPPEPEPEPVKVVPSGATGIDAVSESLERIG